MAKKADTTPAPKDEQGTEIKNQEVVSTTVEQPNYEVAISAVNNALERIEELAKCRASRGMAITRMRKIMDELRGIAKTLQTYA